MNAERTFLHATVGVSCILSVVLGLLRGPKGTIKYWTIQEKNGFYGPDSYFVTFEDY